MEIFKEEEFEEVYKEHPEYRGSFDVKTLRIVVDLIRDKRKNKRNKRTK